MPFQSSTHPTIAYNPVPFNFVDLEEKATKYIAQVKAEAAQVISNAREEVERIQKVAVAAHEKSTAELEQARAQAQQEAKEIRKQLDQLQERLKTEEENFKIRKEQLENEAEKLRNQMKQDEETARKKGYEDGKKLGYDEGHSKGYADGEMKATIDYAEKVQREAEIQLGAKMETLLPALKSMIDQLDLAKEAFLLHWEQSAVGVAQAIAAKAISRQLPAMIDVPLLLLRETLELSTGSTSVRIRLNNDDYVALRPQIDTLIAEMTRSMQVEIVGDASISPGGCLLETPQGTIDNRIESRLDRIKQELCLETTAM